MRTESPIVVVGSINIDLVASAKNIPAPGETLISSSFAVHPGGKGANQAVAVARLGHPVNLIGRLGDDAFGAQLREQLITSGVDVKGVMTSPGPSGVAIIVVAANGENSIVISPGANALLTPADLDRNIGILRSASVVLAQLEIPLETVIHLADICKKEAIPFILDPAPAQTLPPDLFAKVAWFTPNETEATFFVASNGVTSSDDTSQIARTLLNKGAEGVILKLGARGAYLANGSGLCHSAPSFAVNAVDTTAAGDTFNGAFATGLATGMTPSFSVQFAVAAAALSVTRFGAQPSMPTRSEVMHLLQNTPTPKK